MGFYDELAELTRSGRRFVLGTVIATKGSTPQKPGAKIAVPDTGPLIGTIGGGAIEKQIVDAAQLLLSSATQHTTTLETHLTHELGMCCGGRMTVFLEKHDPMPQLFIFGAGHVSRELASLAASVELRVTVIDERTELNTAERFPNVERVIENPADVAARLEGSARSYFCVTTHDHPLDQACVEALLRKPSAYLGVIGSQRKAERFRQRLKAAQFRDEEIARLESPMGLDIGAQTPREIAVSILARLIQLHRATESAKTNG